MNVTSIRSSTSSVASVRYNALKCVFEWKIDSAACTAQPTVFSDGKLRYAQYNTLFTYSPRTGECSLSSYPTQTITAVALLPRGNVIIGDSNGTLFLPNMHPISTEVSSPIQSIQPISQTHSVIEFENGLYIIFDLEETSRLGKWEKIESLYALQGLVVSFDGKCIKTMQYDASTNSYKIIGEPIKGIAKLRQMGSSELLLFHDDKVSFTFWNPRRSISFAHAGFWKSRNSPYHHLTRIDEETVLLTMRFELILLSHTDEKILYRAKESWGINTTLSLSDGSILYMSDSRGATLRLLDQKGRSLFFDQDTAPNDRIVSLVETDPGLVVAVGACRTFVFKIPGIDLPPEKIIKNRLFIGEGDFSYTEAYYKKHPTHSIVATDLEPQQRARERVARLMREKIPIFFGIDAKAIHQIFKGKRFHRIQWNCPFGGSAEKERKKFKDVVPLFFRAASRLQQPGDRIQVTLDQPRKNGTTYWQFRQQENPIVKGSLRAGYRLIGKRRFTAERYPGYTHVKTDGEPFSGGDELEFIFEKLRPGKRPKRPSERKYFSIEPVNERTKNQYYVCSSDDASSSDEEPLPEEISSSSGGDSRS